MLRGPLTLLSVSGLAESAPVQRRCPGSAHVLPDLNGHVVALHKTGSRCEGCYRETGEQLAAFFDRPTASELFSHKTGADLEVVIPNGEGEGGDVSLEQRRRLEDFVQGQTEYGSDSLRIYIQTRNTSVVHAPGGQNGTASSSADSAKSGSGPGVHASESFVSMVRDEQPRGDKVRPSAPLALSAECQDIVGKEERPAILIMENDGTNCFFSDVLPDHDETHTVIVPLSAARNTRDLNSTSITEKDFVLFVRVEYGYHHAGSHNDNPLVLKSVGDCY